jgi:hypothetical protein
MLELILTVADKPEWYTQQVMAEVQRRRRKANRRNHALEEASQAST